MIEYKDYIGSVEFDEEIESFHGTVINTNDVITFYGYSVSELKEEMKKSVETYLEFCKEQGRKPEQPFSEKLLIQKNPELNRRVANENALLSEASLAKDWNRIEEEEAWASFQ